MRQKLPELSKLPSGCRVTVVKDDDFAPFLRCGMFVVVDPADCTPTPDALMLYSRRNKNGERCDDIVRLVYPDQRLIVLSEQERALHPAPYWRVAFREARNPRFSNVIDGPVSERRLKPFLAGRIIGRYRARGA